MEEQDVDLIFGGEFKLQSYDVEK